MKKYNVAVVGATGAVGQEMLKILEQRKFPVNKLKPLATSRSEGKQIIFKKTNITVKKTTAESFNGIDITLFAGGGKASEEFGWEAVKRGSLVIDNSSAFRMHPEVPLVVPEVNPKALKTHKGLIANPNCSTIQMVVALQPIHKIAKIKRIVVSTYQSVSGTGKDAMIELEQQTKTLIGNKLIPSRCHQAPDCQSVKCKVYPYQIAFNVLPHIDIFMGNGYTKEEVKMINETRKIMNEPNLLITATAVRVPVFIGHSESVNIETERPITPEKARKILSSAPGIIVIDALTTMEKDPLRRSYPLPIMAVGRDEVFVGRIRKDISVPNGIDMWIVADNLRKGAALNAVQIAELLIK